MIWVDVEDIFFYMSRNSRPSGIQRLEYELCRALVDIDQTKGEIRFVRHKADSYSVIDFSLLDLTYSKFVEDNRNPRVVTSDHGFSRSGNLPGSSRHFLRRFLALLPPRVYSALQAVYFHQRSAISGLGGVASACLQAVRGRYVAAPCGDTAEPSRAELHGPSRDAPEAWGAGTSDHDAFEKDVRPGDFLLILGAAWFPGYAASLARVIERKGLRLAVLMYDIVPLRRPEWCDATMIENFATWVEGVLPLTDVVLTISRSTASELERYAADTLIALRSRPQPIPIGTGFTMHERGHGETRSADASHRTKRLPPAGTYALIVSTIEARKNHALLLRVWRRLLDEMSHDQVPSLVFAGRVGWLVADLMAQLKNSDFLNGKIVLIENPSDSELEALYAGCMFTLFPSFYEGWGLPVTESLSHGRPCVISNATSLPEAGGTLARYIDPDDVSGAYDVIRGIVEDPQGLEDWRARIERDFKPVPWQDSARAILAALALAATKGARLDHEPVAKISV